MGWGPQRLDQVGLPHAPRPRDSKNTKQNLLPLLQKGFKKLSKNLLAWSRDQLHFVQHKDKIQSGDTFWLLKGEAPPPHVHACYPQWMHRHSFVSTKPTRGALQAQNEKQNCGPKAGVLQLRTAPQLREAGMVSTEHLDPQPLSCS